MGRESHAHFPLFTIVVEHLVQDRIGPFVFAIETEPRRDFSAESGSRPHAPVAEPPLIRMGLGHYLTVLIELQLEMRDGRSGSQRDKRLQPAIRNFGRRKKHPAVNPAEGDMIHAMEDIQLGEMVLHQDLPVRLNVRPRTRHVDLLIEIREDLEVNKIDADAPISNKLSVIFPAEAAVRQP